MNASLEQAPPFENLKLNERPGRSLVEIHYLTLSQILIPANIYGLP